MSDESPPTPAGEPRHRSDAGRRRPLLIAVVLAVVLAAGAGILWWRSDSPRSVAAPVRPTPTHRTPTPTPTPPPSPTHTVPPKPVIPHEVVAGATPTQLRVHGKVAGHEITITAHVCAMPDIRPIDPPGEQRHTVCWIETDDGFGGIAPSSRGGTAYIFGHSWAEDPLEVLNKISSPATEQLLAARAHPKYVSGVPIYPVTNLNGLLVTVWTSKGRLTYKVRDAYGVAKSQAGDVAPLMNNKIKNRLVLFTCSERNGVDYDYDVVVDAYLWSSQKRTPTT